MSSDQVERGSPYILVCLVTDTSAQRHNFSDARVPNLTISLTTKYYSTHSFPFCSDVPGGVHNSYLDFQFNPDLTCVPMSLAFINAINQRNAYYGPNPCAVSSAPCFCIDLKNVAAVS